MASKLVETQVRINLLSDHIRTSLPRRESMMSPGIKMRTVKTKRTPMRTPSSLHKRSMTSLILKTAAAYLEMVIPTKKTSTAKDLKVAMGTKSPSLKTRDLMKVLMLKIKYLPQTRKP
jgi:hypothetical protein